MANRAETLTQNELHCPNCNYDYTNDNLIERFNRSGNAKSINLRCDCKQLLAFKKLSNFFKIYDITEIKKRDNAREKLKRKGKLRKEYRNHWNLRHDNYLTCYWCNHDNDLKGVQDMFKAFPFKDRIHYSCDKCNRKSSIQITSRGFYVMHPADKHRYLRNVAKGTARLITLKDHI
jgi:hypothetical protein